jgi:hypothetical protein
MTEKFTLPPLWDSHHLFWTRRSYHTRTDRAFRTHFGLVIPTPLINHRNLHHEIEPPLKPDRDMMTGLMDVLEDTPEGNQHDRLWGLDKAIHFFDDWRYNTSSCEESVLADAIHCNLTRQAGVLALRMSTERASM